jgi:hypothetical protein
LDFAKKMNHVFEQNKTESVFFDLGLKKNKLKIKTLLGLKLMNTYRPLL